MTGSKTIGMLLIGVLLLAGLGPFGSRAPLAGERQAAETGNRPAKASPPAGAVELRCRVEQPTVVLFAVAPGDSVNKGDLLVELDSSAFMDKRIQQVFQVRKADAEMARAARSRQSAEQAGQGQIDLAQRALRLAQGYLKAYTEGEHPNQLAHASGTVALAEQRAKMLEDRYAHLRHAAETQKDEAAIISLQEAELTLKEAQMQLALANNSLAMLKGIGHDNRIAELELAVTQKEFELARAKTAIADANMQADIVLSLAKMSRTMEADRLARLDDQIVKCKIYAPQDGTINQPRNADEGAVQPGAVVRERQVLLRLLPATSPKP